MVNEIEPHPAKENGNTPRWVVYERETGEFEIVGPFDRRMAEIIAINTDGIMYAERPDFAHDGYINLTYDKGFIE